MRTLSCMKILAFARSARRTLLGLLARIARKIGERNRTVGRTEACSRRIRNYLHRLRQVKRIFVFRAVTQDCLCDILIAVKIRGERRDIRTLGYTQIVNGDFLRQIHGIAEVVVVPCAVEQCQTLGSFSDHVHIAENDLAREHRAVVLAQIEDIAVVNRRVLDERRAEAD